MGKTRISRDRKGLLNAGPRLWIRLLPGLVVALGLLFKLFYLWSYASSNPYYGVPRLDSAIYVDWAKSIIHDGWLGKEVFYQAPLYPYLLSVIFWLFGHDLLNVYVMQAIMGACIVGLFYLIGKDVYNVRSGLISALLCLTYAPFTFYETKILTTETEMFLGLLYLFLLAKAEREKIHGYWTAGAVFLGLAILCRPNYILVVPCTVVALFLRYRKQPKDIVPALAAVCIVPALIIGVVTLRNYVVGKDFVLISSSGGVTFAQGNNSMARGGLVPLPGFSGSAVNQQEEDIRIAEREMGHIYSETGRSEEAAESYERVILLNPKSTEGYLRLGALLGRRGKHQRAREVLLDGLKVNPENIGLQYNHAVACFILGDREEAREQLKEVMSKDPDFAESRRLMQQLELKK